MSKTFWISLFVAAWGLSASSQTVPTINACVNNLSGVTRVVASSANCVGGIETFKQWNVTGPQGPTGARGLTGQQGAAGPTGRPGAVGTQGPQGPTGAQGPAGPSGSTGAQGPAGPAGQTGPSGATGAAGGQVYEANLTVPSSIANATPTNPAYFLGAVTGKDTLTSFSVSETPDLPSHELIVPTDCVAQNFSVTQIGAQGIDDGVVALATSTDPTGSTGITPSELVCPLAATGTTGASAVSSCSTGATAKLPAGTAIFLLVGLVSAWANAHLLVRFTCN